LEEGRNILTYYCAGSQFREMPKAHIAISRRGKGGGRGERSITKVRVGFLRTTFPIPFCLFLWLGFPLKAAKGVRRQVHGAGSSGGLYWWQWLEEEREGRGWSIQERIAYLWYH